MESIESVETWLLCRNYARWLITVCVTALYLNVTSGIYGTADLKYSNILYAQVYNLQVVFDFWS